MQKWSRTHDLARNEVASCWSDWVPRIATLSGIYFNNLDVLILPCWESTFQKQIGKQTEEQLKWQSHSPPLRGWEHQSKWAVSFVDTWRSFIVFRSLINDSQSYPSNLNRNPYFDWLIFYGWEDMIGCSCMGATHCKTSFRHPRDVATWSCRSTARRCSTRN